MGKLIKRRTVDNEGKLRVKERLLGLLQALGLEVGDGRYPMEHEVFAALTGGHLDRYDISAAARGLRLASSTNWPKGLAHAFGITMTEADDYWEGRLSLADLFALRNTARKPLEVPSRLVPGFPALTRAIAGMRVVFGDDDAALYDVLDELREPLAEDQNLNEGQWAQRILDMRRARLAHAASRPSPIVRQPTLPGVTTPNVVPQNELENRRLGKLVGAKIAASIPPRSRPTKAAPPTVRKRQQRST